MIWKYIIRDLNGAMQYLPYGVMAGAVMGLILNAMNAEEGAEGKRSLSDGWSHGVSLYLMIILVITFFLQRGWQQEPRYGSGAFLHLGDQYEK